MFAIAPGVVISPQLLPAIANVTIARGAREMAGQGVAARRPKAIETWAR